MSRPFVSPSVTSPLCGSLDELLAPLESDGRVRELIAGGLAVPADGDTYDEFHAPWTLLSALAGDPTWTLDGMRSTESVRRGSTLASGRAPSGRRRHWRVAGRAYRGHSARASRHHADGDQRSPRGSGARSPPLRNSS